MKNVVLLTLCMISICMYGQETTKPEFDGHKWEAPYNLPLPKDWTFERFLIPISFAPQIPYKGVEDIRFTSGWGNAESEEYWTYAFLWYLETSPKMDAETIDANLKAYYTGLIEINREGFKVPLEKVTPVKTSFKEIAKAGSDIKTFTGTVEMLDYMQQKPMTLNCMVHMRSCPEEKKTIMFYQLSPKPPTHKNWQSLNQLWADFQCKKN
jgi:hypothetical protein